MSIGVIPAMDRDQLLVRAMQKSLAASMLLHLALIMIAIVAFGANDGENDHTRSPRNLDVKFVPPPSSLGDRGHDSSPPEPVPPNPPAAAPVSTPEPEPARTPPPEILIPPAAGPPPPENETPVVADPPPPEPAPPGNTTPEAEPAGPEPRDPPPSFDPVGIDRLDQASGGPGAGVFNPLSGSSDDPILSAYLAQVSAEILSWLRIPPSVPGDRDLHVNVYLYLDAGGNVLEYKVDALSGNKALDNAVTAMLDELKKLPAPPPEKMDGGRFELPVRFEPEG